MYHKSNYGKLCSICNADMGLSCLAWLTLSKAGMFFFKHAPGHIPGGARYFETPIQYKDLWWKWNGAYRCECLSCFFRCVDEGYQWWLQRCCCGAYQGLPINWWKQDLEWSLIHWKSDDRRRLLIQNYNRFSGFHITAKSRKKNHPPGNYPPEV